MCLVQLDIHRIIIVCILREFQFLQDVCVWAAQEVENDSVTSHLYACQLVRHTARIQVERT